MNFNTYRYFNEVAETGSIRRAADRLHVAPSAISRQLAILEHRLGTLLLERTSTGMQLTPAGIMLERYTRNMFRDLERVQVSIKDMKGLKEGEVKVWAIEGLMLEFLPRALADFNSLHPAIRFLVYSESTDRILEAMIRDEADIGIVFNAKPRAGIEIVAEYSEPVMCLLSENHPFASRDSLTLAEICSQQIALPIASFGLRQLFDKAIARQNLRPNVLLFSNNLEMTRTMAMTGLAITISPTMSAIRDIRDGSLKAIPVQDTNFANATAAICVHRDRPLNYAANAFLKTLIREFPAAGGLAA